MNCPKCSFENRDGSKFCNECGHPLPASGPLPIIEAPSSYRVSSHETADLSGIERMVDPGYAPPSPSWRSGSTAELPHLNDEPRRLRTYQAPVEDEVPRKSAAKRVVLGAIAFCAVLGLAAFATYSMEVWGGKTVPDVVGRSQADALYMLESKGFQVRSTQVKSDDVEGIVLLMDPSSHSRQEAGSEVVVHVSVPRVIPSIVGIPKLNAVNLMEEEGFTNVSYVEVKSNEHEGMVLSVSPEPTTKAKAATAITVEVAVPFTVPEVFGLSQDQAVVAIEEEGYAVSVAWTYSEEVTEGCVVVTEPAAGSELATGSTVTLYLAKSRANELVNATRSYLSSQEMFVVGGETYSVKPDTVELSYEGDDTVRYVVEAQRAETHYWDVTGEYETKYGEKVTLEGLIFWDENTTVLGGEPTIYKAR
ncbi:MAG: PASTA domain-containing protein [Eggerthellaceae bacterium]|nr:PASTA domain-containing protein [Eggerthellaceae bacterium]